MKNSPSSLKISPLLMLNQGGLNITIIPRGTQPDWIVPSALILDSMACSERVSSYEWQQQPLAVYSLLLTNAAPTTVVILQGSSEQQRLGLLIEGALTERYIQVSDIKDLDTSPISTASTAPNFVFQEVILDQQVFVVPDLAKLAKMLYKTK